MNCIIQVYNNTCTIQIAAFERYFDHEENCWLSYYYIFVRTTTIILLFNTILLIFSARRIKANNNLFRGAYSFVNDGLSTFNLHSPRALTFPYTFYIPRNIIFNIRQSSAVRVVHFLFINVIFFVWVFFFFWVLLNIYIFLNIYNIALVVCWKQPLCAVDLTHFKIMKIYVGMLYV